eukprot:PhF_6_TR13204/c0_g1_i1/m.20861
MFFKIIQEAFASDSSTLERKWRHGLVAAMFLAWMYFSLDVLVAVIPSSPTWERFLQKFSNIVFVVTIPVGLCRAYFEKQNLSHATLSFFAQICNICTSISAAQVNPVRTTHLQAILLMNVIAITDLPYWKTQCLTLLPGMIISAYNATFGLNGHAMIVMVEPETGLFREIIAQSRILWMVPISLIMVRTLSMAYSASLRRLEGAVAIAKSVSEHLAEYNTKAAEAVLSEYSNNNLNCDYALLTALRVIVDDMKKYKPFLPNYVVDSEGEEESEDTMYATETSVVKGAVVSKRRPSNGRGCAPLPPPEPQEDSPTMQTSSPPHHLLLERRSRREEKHPPKLVMIPITRRVTNALLDFRVVCDDMVANPNVLRQFIDTVYRYANASKGAVHSCVCDTVHMTWNAVNQSPIPEQSAVRSTHLLNNPKDAASSTRVQVHGSVMTGLAECRITGTVHQTFLFQIDWLDAQQALHRYARHVGTNVVCAHTAKAITDVTMCVDVLENHQKPLLVYELTTCEIHDKYGFIMEGAVKALIDNDVDLARRVLSDVDGLSSRSIGGIPQSVEYLRKKVIVY